MRRPACGAAVAVIAMAAASASAAAALVVPPLDRVTPFSGEVVVRGELRSSFDGSTFDAVTQRDQFPRLAGEPAPRLGGLFESGRGRAARRRAGSRDARLPAGPDGGGGPGLRGGGRREPVPGAAAGGAGARAAGHRRGVRRHAGRADRGRGAGAAGGVGGCRERARLAGGGCGAAGGGGPGAPRPPRPPRLRNRSGAGRGGGGAAGPEGRRHAGARARADRAPSRCAPRSSTARAAPAPPAWRVSSPRGS